MKTVRRPKREPTSSPLVWARGPEETARIAWLLELLRLDVTSLPPDRLLLLRNDVFPYLHESSHATVSPFDPDEMLALGPVPPGRATRSSDQVIAAARHLLGGVQHQLRAGLDALQQTGTWWPFAIDAPAPHWWIEQRPDGTVQRSYAGTWTTITLASAADLLWTWWPQLRRCGHEACRVWFLPTHGRQQYHDAKCAGKARYERFKPTRNHKAEYARRYDSTRKRVRRTRQ